jgi:serine/threonine protein kinase
MSLAAGTRLGPYEVLGLIGSGGMGEVYKARDTRLDRSVAVKILPAELSADPERRTRFEREARAVAALSHPHICTLHDIGTHDGTTLAEASVSTRIRAQDRFALHCRSRAGQPGVPV